MFKRIVNKIVAIIEGFYCHYTIPSSDAVYITFDDGPEPEITEFILDLLNQYGAKATFFCVGNNIQKNYHLYERIKSSGHSIGSHTMSHLRGVETPNSIYIKEIKDFTKQYKSRLFRPPYGQLSLAQLIYLIVGRYKVILWSLDTQDWVHDFTIINNVRETIQKLKAGDIILLHFSKQHAEKTIRILPILMDEISEKKLVCKAIDSKLL